MCQKIWPRWILIIDKEICWWYWVRQEISKLAKLPIKGRECKQCFVNAAYGILLVRRLPQNLPEQNINFSKEKARYCPRKLYSSITYVSISLWIKQSGSSGLTLSHKKSAYTYTFAHIYNRGTRQHVIHMQVIVTFFLLLSTRRIEPAADSSPFQLQITAMVLEWPLQKTLALLWLPSWLTAAVREPTLLFVTESLLPLPLLYHILF